MTNIISPLDNILQTVNELIKTSHTARRGSSLSDAFQSIIDDVNVAKNNIISHFIEGGNNNNKNNTQKLDETYAAAVHNKRMLKNNIIIPVDTKLPDKSKIESFDNKLYKLLSHENSSATVLKTSATDNGNYVINFKSNDCIDNIKDKLSSEFGNNIKIIKPIQPKIKIVGVPNQFNTSCAKEEIVNSIIDSNDILRDEFLNNKDCLQFLFSYNTGTSKSIVLKCSANARNMLRNNNDTLKINHKLCKLYDRYHLLQCSKCCKLGHTSKTCKSEELHCTFCAGNHAYSTCPVKDQDNKHQCYNCMNNTTATPTEVKNHNSFSHKCPIRTAALNKLIARTDTGTSCL